MKRLALCYLLFLAAIPASATTRYISQAGGTVTCNGGSQTSISVATFNALTPSAGDINILCGTITSRVNLIANGAAGNVIVLKWDAGAKITMPVCPGTDTTCVQVSGSFILLDGGIACGYGTNCRNQEFAQTQTLTGVIESTANGSPSGFPNSAINNSLIFASGHDIEIKNLILRNAYQYTDTTDQNGGNGQDPAIAYTVTSNLFIHDNAMHDDGTGLRHPGSCNGIPLDNVQFYKNDLWNYNWGFQDGTGPSCPVHTNLFIHDDHFGSPAKFDNNGISPDGKPNHNHHNGVFLFDGGRFVAGAGWDNVYIYNNLFDGSPGLDSTDQIFFETQEIGHFYLWNNVVNHTSNTMGENTDSMFGLAADDTNQLFLYNNTLIGATIVPTGGKNNNSGCLAIHGQLTFQNNIVTGCPFGGILVAQAQIVTQNAPTLTRFSGNVYGDSIGSNKALWQDQGTGGGGSFTTFPAWQSFVATKTGSLGEAGSKYINPYTLNSDASLPSGNGAIGAATNLTSLCVGPLVSLCQDTTLGGSRTPFSRPASGNWDAGAFQFSGVPTAASPVINPPQGAYPAGSQTISMSCASPSSTIYYTTNGTTPTHGSATYSTAFPQVLPVTIKAICTSGTLADSSVTTNVYTLRATGSIVNWTSLHQTIDGFGASDWAQGAGTGPENMTQAQANMFFSQSSGIGLSFVRSLGNQACIGHVTDLGTLQKAVALGAQVWVTMQSPPTSMKDSGNCTLGNLNAGSYGAYATFVVNWIQGLQSSGIPIYAISPVNEPDVAIAGTGNSIGGFAFGSSIAATQSGLNTFLKTNLCPSLVSAGLSTKVMIDDDGVWSERFSLASTAMNDSTTRNCISILGAHGYGYASGPPFNTGGPAGGPDGFGVNPCCSNPTAPPFTPNGGRIWQSEINGASNPGVFDPSIGNALVFAHNIHDYLTVVQATSWQYWELVAGGSDNEGLTDHSFNPAKRMYALGNWSKFVRPGYQRIDTPTSPASGLAVTAFRDTVSNTIVLVGVNTSGTDITQSFAINNGPSFLTLTPWETSAAFSLAARSTISVSGGGFSYKFPAQSVTTLTGQAASGTTPNISSLSLTSGIVGTTFDILGSNFGATQGSSIAQLNGMNLTINSWSASDINVTVPPGAMSGTIAVTVGGISSNGAPFVVVGVQPQISPAATEFVYEQR